MMSTPGVERPGLRERKQRRTRQAITDAAIELFATHGFDTVTVTDIVDRAEVGRSTFFRYFGDKQDVLFADDAELLDVLTAAARRFPADRPAQSPLSGDLVEAVTVTRDAMLELLAYITGRYGERVTVRDEIIRGHEALTARGLLKQRRYAHALAEVLLARGVPDEVAALAAHLALACYSVAHEAGGRAGDLAPATERAFDALFAVVSDHGSGRAQRRRD